MSDTWTTERMREITDCSLNLLRQTVLALAAGASASSHLPWCVILHELVCLAADGHDALESVLDVHVLELLDVLGLEQADFGEESVLRRQQCGRGNHVAAIGVQEREGAVDEVAEIVQELRVVLRE